jgi:hypothetical protein
MLLGISSYSHPGSGQATPLPLNQVPFASSVATLRAVCRAIFGDETEDPNLRGLCLRFLLDQRGDLASARVVFARTHSDTLKYLIEDEFLDVSDHLYETLHAPSGGAATIILPVRSCNSYGVCACGEKPNGKPVFLVEYHMEGDIFSDYLDSKKDVDSGLVLISRQSGRQFVLDEGVWENYSNAGEVGWVKLPVTNVKDVPPGDYILHFCYRRNGAVISVGFGTPVSIEQTALGSELKLSAKAYPEIPAGWGW